MHKSTSNQNLKKQFPVNVLSNVAYSALNVGIGIWYIPYLINHLGVALYGLIPLATSITAYMKLLSMSFNSSVTRYMTIDLQRKDTDKANQTFNTGFIGSFFVVLVIAPLAVLIAYFIPDILEVPVGQGENVRLLFFATVAAFLLTIINSNFSVSSFARNRFDISNGIESLGLLVRIFLIVILFKYVSAQIYFVGYSLLGGSIIVLFGSICAWKVLTPELKIDFGQFRRSRLIDLTGTGGWMLINQLSALLFLNIDLIVVNKMFGAEASGQYAIVLQWRIYLRTVVATLAAVLTPTILTYYAQKQVDQLLEVSKKAVKLLGLLIALPIGLICGFAYSFLSIWINPEFSNLAPLMWLMVGHLCINLAVLPLFSIQVAMNKVKVPGIVALTMGVLNLILAIGIPLLFKTGMYGVAVAGAIVLTAKNTFFTPWYVARILDKPWYTFMMSTLTGVLATLAVALTSFGIDMLVNPAGWVELLSCFCMIGLVYFLIVYYVLLKYDERSLLLSFMPGRP